MKKVIHIALSSIISFLCLASVAPAGALTYQDEADIKFVFNSTLSVSLSDNSLIINNLVPGQSATSNALSVTVNTNNVWGYTLSATVGDSTKNYRDLKHTDGAASFASIAVGSNVSTLPSDGGSVWGFSKTLDGSTWSNYNGLPKYDDSESVAELKAAYGAANNDTVGFRIGAKAAEGQLAGDYTNVINFIAVANNGPLFLQNVTTATCPTAITMAYDIRDMEEYKIQKLADGRCWMMENLRLDPDTLTTSLSSDNTNLAQGTTFTLPSGTSGYDFSYSGGGSPSIATVVKNMTMNNGVENTKWGVYYNICAASAGTACDGSDAEYDICPKGWSLPTGSYFSDGTSDFSALYNAYNQIGEAVVAAFRPARIGEFHGSAPELVGSYGYYWSSTSAGGGETFALILDNYASSYGKDNSYGLSVRCVAK